MAETVERFGRLDIIVNAIGGGAGKVLFDAQEYPMDAWDWIMDLNLTTTLLATQAAVTGDDRRRATAARSQHLVGARPARHQRRLLGLRGRQGSDRLAHPAVGHRVGQARHHVNAISPDVRRHPPGGHAARRPRLQGRHRRRGSRWAGSGPPTT